MFDQSGKLNMALMGALIFVAFFVNTCTLIGALCTGALVWVFFPTPPSQPNPPPAVLITA
jgi:hypothetical protein